MMELQHASRATNPCCTNPCCYNGDGGDDDLTKCKMLQPVSKDQHHSSTLLRHCCYYTVHGSFPGAQNLFSICRKILLQKTLFVLGLLYPAIFKTGFDCRHANSFVLSFPFLEECPWQQH
jgi:hypothetical protein